jgi:hypothetical protein
VTSDEACAGIECNLQVRRDSSRRVAFNIKENPYLDYGYDVTSHSSHGQTAGWRMWPYRVAATTRSFTRTTKRT